MQNEEEMKEQGLSKEWTMKYMWKTLDAYRMELINILKEYRGTRRSVRNALRIYGADNDEMLTQPLATMLPNRAIRLVINWLMTNAEAGHQIELRLFEPSEQKIYISNLEMENGGIYVRGMSEKPVLTNEILYIWEPSITYQTLTVEEIKQSVKRADAAKLLNDCGALEQLFQ